jgi:hypothetical protein
MKRVFAMAVAFCAVVAIGAVVGLMTSGTATAATVPSTWYTEPFCVGGVTWWLTDSSAEPPPPLGEVTAQEFDIWIAENDGTIYVLYGAGGPWASNTADTYPGSVGVTAARGICTASPPVPGVVPPEPAREAYCAVAGNTLLDGTPLAPGTFLNLLAGQPNSDKHYTGAVPAFWVQGTGLTCSLSPAQAALAAASTVMVGGGGDVLPPAFGGLYTFIPVQ